MIKHYLTLTLVIVVSIFMDEVRSDEYSVLLGTSDKSLIDDYDVLKIYGNLYTTQDTAGKVQTRLGPYTCEACVREILHEVQVAGHNQAKLIVHDKRGKSSSNNTMTGQRYISNTFDIQSLLDEKTLVRWNKLTPKQQSNLSYFNGELLIKDGETYYDFDYYKN